MSDSEVVDERRAPKRLGQDMKPTNAKKPKTKNVGKYLRPAPEGRVIHNTSDKKLKSELKRSDKKFSEAALQAAKAEILLPEESGILVAEGLEKTHRFTQEQLAEHVDINTANKMFDLTLDTFGPYKIDYTRNGRNLLLGGAKGHIAVFDALRMNLGCEFHVKESVRDKKYAYIYDHTGAEAHCLRTMSDPKALEFLPYHFLLACVGGGGVLSYNDVTTGTQIANHKTKLGMCDVMVQNKHNAVINLGHASGIVTLWTPNLNEAVVKIKCHDGPVRGLAVDRSGKYLVSTGSDHKMRVFDLRTYKQLHQYYLRGIADAITISDRDMIAVGYGPNVEVWHNALTTKAQAPYMTHRMPARQATSIRFRPYEDVLSIGHSKGLANIVIPGAGEPNFDSFEANPFESTKQRRETEIKSLLEKLRPEMITLNPMAIGRIDANANDEHGEKIETMYKANNEEAAGKPKKKMRGKNRPSRKLRKKQQNVVDIEKQKYRDALEKKAKDEAKANADKQWKDKVESAPTALNRFYKKP
ncbi:hypothetical protein SPRG_18957 [Saprolegnia parasitica CBS 223.65]|uniref:BING4 C-terminal domain-containing protein n=1 Tax=Saprolegnia parasitica (strain CBS 223.65) TaxID=695850 RepID=A0A067D0E2_SAPPC|nr:hypothetical protein SPRG_18957 [Saprolegnia parasitica CBS 223.65]KDO34990.1 hypothetical protein SPRG_18957 [Saprolegnia parasitica CBS 223.65]|eukprot:XP_012194824.1 hypothetical protein SPRG_18957 [Saprolegnia parasitica CBS 223.65]